MLQLGLNEEERQRYAADYRLFAEVNRRFRRLHPQGTWQEFVFAASQSREGRAALPAWRRTQRLVAELVEAGEIVPVRIEGLKEPYYVSRAARAPKTRDYQALLAPFDPVVWQRQRTHDLFGFHYRLEIYTPAAERKHGYYVLPFLLGDRLVARVDLKSDRKRNRLQVVAVHAEAGAPSHAAEALARELRLLADWLGLATIAVGRRGNFAKALGRQFART